jgi:hypothetical protein
MKMLLGKLKPLLKNIMARVRASIKNIDDTIMIRFSYKDFLAVDVMLKM